MARLIDADELEKKLAGYFTGDRGGEATMRELIIDESIADSIRIIREQPTVDAEPVRHGIWINRNLIADMATCSCCGDRWGSASVMNYCPNCGAKMDGEEVLEDGTE